MSVNEVLATTRPTRRQPNPVPDEIRTRLLETDIASLRPGTAWGERWCVVRFQRPRGQDLLLPWVRAALSAFLGWAR